MTNANTPHRVSIIDREEFLDFHNAEAQVLVRYSDHRPQIECPARLFVNEEPPCVLAHIAAGPTADGAMVASGFLTNQEFQAIGYDGNLAPENQKPIVVMSNDRIGSFPKKFVSKDQLVDGVPPKLEDAHWHKTMAEVVAQQQQS